MMFTVVGALEIAFPPCIGVFNDSPAVLEAGKSLDAADGRMRAVDRGGMIFTQALFGAGNTRFVMRSS